MKLLRGVPASPGIGLATARVLVPDAISIPDVPPDDAEAEAAALAVAASAVAAGLRTLAGAVEDAEAREILEAQAVMALDPVLLEEAAEAVRRGPCLAARAIVDVGERYAEQLAESDDEYLAARSTDIRDVCGRIARRLVGEPESATAHWTEPAVLVGRELSPADALALDWSLIRGIATVDGGRTGHMAILARNFGVPAVVAVGGLLDVVAAGATVALDGEAGTVVVDPDPPTASALLRRAEEQRSRRDALAQLRGLPGRTRDGRAVEIACNVGSARELEAALALGAEGVGLLRTELFAIDRRHAPTEDEQVAELERLCELLAGRRLVVRVLDIGADKPARFLPLSPEPNPALGMRGIRLLRRRPELLRTQLRAVARVASKGARLGVMAPMIATVDEAEWFAAELAAAGIRDAGVETGVMVEVPSAVLLAEELAARFDFLSVGTNDLTQYLHGADRESGGLTALQDPFSPAVLRAVQAVCAAAEGRAWVGVCGEAAGDAAWACVAVGLGATELSMAAAAMDEVRATVRSLTHGECRALAAAAVAAPTAAAARAAVDAGEIDMLSSLDERGAASCTGESTG